MTRRGGTFVCIAIAACAALLAGGAFAMSDAELERRVLEISNELRCPTCQAISVKDSDAAFSRQMRDKIRAMLEDGKNDEEIKAYFVASYGEWVLRAPKKEGVGLLLWALPIASIAVAGGLLLWRQRRAVKLSQPPPESAAPAPSIGAEARARIEQDLRRFERGF